MGDIKQAASLMWPVGHNLPTPALKLGKGSTQNLTGNSLSLKGVS